MSTAKDMRQTAGAMPKFFVHIVESPSPEDLLSGRVEGHILTQALRLAGIENTYYLATSEVCFRKAIGPLLYEDARSLGGAPILHLSTHGNQQGIGLSDGSFIPWNELRELLRPINEAIDGSLVVCMSSCSGHSGCQMAMADGASLPFFGLIGHTGTPSWSDTAVAFVTFYHLFFKGTPVPDAVQAMRVASGDPGFSAMLGQKARQFWADFVAQHQHQQMIERLRRMAESQAPPDASSNESSK